MSLSYYSSGAMHPISSPCIFANGAKVPLTYLYYYADGARHTVFQAISPDVLFFEKSSDFPSSKTLFIFPKDGTYKVYLIGKGGNGGEGGKSWALNAGSGGGGGGSGGVAVSQIHVSSSDEAFYYKEGEILHFEAPQLSLHMTVHPGSDGQRGEDASLGNPFPGGGNGGTGGAAAGGNIGNYTGAGGKYGALTYGGGTNTPPATPYTTPPYNAGEKQSAYADYELPGLCLGNAGGGGYGGIGGDRTPGSGALGGIIIEFVE